MKKLIRIISISVLCIGSHSLATGSGTRTLSVSTTYYIDSRSGSDNNGGKSKKSPWQTLVRLKDVFLQPGDSVCFKRGSSFTGPLEIVWSGQPGKYITVTDYGSKSDPAPSFTNPVFVYGNYGNCIRVKGSYVIIENLYCSNTSSYKSVPYSGKGWVVWEMGAIHLDSNAQYCIIRDNEIKDCVAGIRSNGEHAVIENNFIHDCNRVLKQWNWGPIGIWLGADFQEVRYNRVFNYSAVDPRIGWGPDSYGGGADGGAMEIDDARFPKSHISIHHNYTRDCQGFLEVTWTDVKQNPDYKNFHIHHNVSDDYQQFVALWRGSSCYIEHNTIIRRKVNANDWGVFNITQRSSKNFIRNNIIVVENGVVVFNLGREGTAKPYDIISNNLYFAAGGKLQMGKEGPGDCAVFADPLFRNYRNASSAEDFTIREGSPAINKGASLGYSNDFCGIRISSKAPDIGAFEFTADKKYSKKKYLPLDYVDPFIGTNNQKPGAVNWKNGETFPGAIVPWGMVSISPHNAPDSKSGYHKGERFLYGFGQVHLSGVGCSDLGNVVLMPTTGQLQVSPDLYKSRYNDEKASAGFYQATLYPSGIKAAMTATTHSSISRYSFPGSDSIANILIDASFTLNSRFNPAPGYIRIVSANEVQGWTESGHFCGAPSQKQRVYFAARFSEAADSTGTWTNGQISDAKQQQGRGVGGFLRFKTNGAKTILVKLGISYVSIDNAVVNLAAEQPEWNFDGILAKARQAWNQTLSRIEVEGGTEAQKTMFYTALYHMFIHPGIFNDVNGEYLSMGHQQVKTVRKGHNDYHVFSLWDTWRNLHVFLTLFYPDRQLDMVESLLDRYKDNHWLPKWEIAGNDAYVMVGDPAGNVLLETYANGLRSFDRKLAYEAMKHNASDTTANPIRAHLSDYLSLGYVPANVRGSVSMTLEYCMADNSVSQFARLLGHRKEYELFRTRSLFYKNLFDTSTGFFRPRNADGSWYGHFEPSLFKGTGFIEGSAWNYLFFVPFDQKGMQTLLGGCHHYVQVLQQVFDDHEFALYNEPDIAFPYLFNYIPGQSWRTQQAVRQGMRENFNTSPGGLPGNDDCGTLSAWYAFSALGLYPDNPVSGRFSLGSPVFSKATIRLNPRYYKGRTFTILADGASDKNRYVRSIYLNGKRCTTGFITYADIENGGSISFKMSANPEREAARD